MLAVVEAVTARLRDPAVTSDVAAFSLGWGLVRASNTQPALVMRCEAASPGRREAASSERLAEIRAAIEAHLAAAGLRRI